MGNETGGDASDQVFTLVDYDGPDGVELLTQGGTGDLRTNGTDARDIIIGNAGENIIIGAGGADVMRGGGGNDTYAVDESSDAVIEAVGEGFDNVYSSVDYIISETSEIESALLTGNAVILRGSSSDNQLIGNDQVNVIDGRGGTDYMIGGGGNDIFQITPDAGAVDVIGDFNNGAPGEGDRIAFAGFNAATTVIVQVSDTSFEVRDNNGTADTADDTVQQFILNDAFGNQNYTGGDLVLNEDYYFS